MEQLIDIIPVVIPLTVNAVLIWRLRMRDKEVQTLTNELKLLNERVWHLIPKVEALTNLLWTDEPVVDGVEKKK